MMMKEIFYEFINNDNKSDSNKLNPDVDFDLEIKINNIGNNSNIDNYVPRS